MDMTVVLLVELLLTPVPPDPSARPRGPRGPPDPPEPVEPPDPVVNSPAQGGFNNRGRRLIIFDTAVLDS